MKKTKNEFKKPNIILYHFIAFFVRIYLRIKLKPEYQLEELKRIKGPAVILCSHTSNLDFLPVAVGLLPLRPTFVMSNHFFVHPTIGKLLRPLHAIPKKMFCADVNAVRQIIKAKNAGNVIVLFAEGRLSCCGHGLPIADGTAELLKKLAVDVYWLEEHGLYKALPKWGKAGLRRGPYRIEGGLLISGEELSELDTAELTSKISKAIYHDDEKAFTAVSYKCPKPALGLDGILYKCPVCGEEFCMNSSDKSISCSACGSSWELDEQYVLHGERFGSINNWFDWEQSSIDLDNGLQCECILATPDETGVMDRSAGSGFFSIDRENIRFTGECHGEALEFTEKCSQIKAFPVSVADHIDIYSNRTLYYIIPQPDPRLSVKYTQYLDKLTAESSKEN